MSDDFSAPSNASGGIKWADNKGSLILFTVHGIEAGIKTVHGEQSAARVDAVILDGPQAGEVYVDTLVFPEVLQGQLKAKVGGKVLGRLSQGNAKPGQSAPWTLEGFSQADAELVKAYIARTEEAPF